MKKMRFLFSMLALSVLALTFASCGDKDKPENEGDLYAGVQHGDVPARFQNKTFVRGSVSVDGYWNDATKYHHSQETLQEYIIKGADGKDVDYFQGITQYAGNNCYNIVLSKYKTAVKFVDSEKKMIITHVQGEYKSNFCTSGVNGERKATKEDLQRASGTYWYKEEEISGTHYLMLYDDPSRSDNRWIGSFRYTP